VADLHTHTTATDGRSTVEEVVAEAARAGLRYLVITDHSVVTFDGVRDLAARYGVVVPFPGVEVSTYHGERRHHILVYGAGLLDPEFQDYLAPPLRAKNRLAGEVRDVLVRSGYELAELDTIRRSAHGPGGPPTPEKRLVSRTALAQHLAVAAGLSLPEAYGRVAAVHRRLDGARPHGPQRLAARYLPTLEVIREATARGLFTSLAHPLWECARTADVEATCEQLNVLRNAGLRGVESRSYHHRDLDDHPVLLSTRDRLGLLATGGSDYHGNGRTTLGTGGLTEEAFLVLAAQVRGVRADA
jgi:predicted metal-dependent phosphoesterase TrpH